MVWQLFEQPVVDVGQLSEHPVLHELLPHELLPHELLPHELLPHELHDPLLMLQPPQLPQSANTTGVAASDSRSMRLNTILLRFFIKSFSLTVHVSDIYVSRNRSFSAFGSAQRRCRLCYFIRVFLLSSYDGMIVLQPLSTYISIILLIAMLYPFLFFLLRTTALIRA